MPATLVKKWRGTSPTPAGLWLTTLSGWRSRQSQLSRGAVVGRSDVGFAQRFCLGLWCWPLAVILSSRGAAVRCIAVDALSRRAHHRLAAVLAVLSTEHASEAGRLFGDHAQAATA